MPVDMVDLSVTTSGSAGSATGTVTATNVVRGKLLAIAFTVPVGTPPATTDITVSIPALGNLPAQTLLTLTNVDKPATELWFYPRVGVVSTANVAREFATGFPVVDLLAMYGTPRVAIAQCDSGIVYKVTLIFEPD